VFVPLTRARRVTRSGSGNYSRRRGLCPLLLALLLTRSSGAGEAGPFCIREATSVRLRKPHPGVSSPHRTSCAESILACIASYRHLDMCPPLAAITLTNPSILHFYLCNADIECLQIDVQSARRKVLPDNLSEIFTVNGQDANA
jgi:hypothetical protein